MTDPDTAIRAAFLRDYARRHPPPGLDNLTVAQRRALLGDAYLGDWRPPTPVEKHGNKGDPGYRLLHPGTGRQGTDGNESPVEGPRRRDVPGQTDLFASPPPAPAPAPPKEGAELASLRADLAALGPNPSEPDVTALGARIVALALADGDPTAELDKQLADLQAEYVPAHHALNVAILDTPFDNFQERIERSMVLGELVDTYIGAKRELTSRRATLRGEAVLAVLSQLRPMGQPVDSRGASRQVRLGKASEAQPMLNEVSRWLPTDWLDRHDAAAPMTVKVARGRAQYDDFKLELTTRKDDKSTTLHEFTHRMEHVVPGISMLEMAFWRRRTNEGRGQRGYGGGRSERVSPDEFADEYIGKTYMGLKPEKRSGPLAGLDEFAAAAVLLNSRATRFWEVASMGMEGLAYDKHGVWDKDRDHINFMAGLLAAAGAPDTGGGA